MRNPNHTRQDASSALVILINNLIDRSDPAVTPALADTAANALAGHALALAQEYYFKQLADHVANHPEG